jgi:hypothetical protein
VSLLLPFLLAGCAIAPYPEYWPEEASQPTISSISPQSVEGMAGGQTLSITGTRLSGTRTVVIGDRNAEVLETTASEVRVLVPPNTAGGGAVDLVLATDGGMARSVEGFTYGSVGSGWWQDEAASLALVRMDCPIEAWAVSAGDWYPMYWCGVEMGYGWGNGVIGTEAQPGFAGDLSDLHPLSALPPGGASAYWGPGEARPLALPGRYGSNTAGDSISVLAQRDFADDLAFVEERMELLADYYSWYDDVVSTEPVAALFDSESCWLADASVLEGDGQTLGLDEAVEGAVGLWLGYSVVEDYEGTDYVYDGYTSTAAGSPTSDGMESTHTGMTLDFYSYSGQFFASGIGEFVGVADLPFSRSYSIAADFGDETLLGEVGGTRELVLESPDLLSGLSQINQNQRYTISWEDLGQDPDPAVVVAELRVYDLDVDSPNGWYELARLVRSAAPETGEIIFTVSDLGELPLATNALDASDELKGLWGELTVSLHQLRKVPLDEGAMVVDFVHAIQSPIDIVRE